MIRSLLNSLGPRRRPDQLRAPPASTSEDSHHLPPEYISIVGYVASPYKFALFIVLSILSGGALAILAKWYPKIWTRLVRVPASRFRDSEYLLLEGRDGRFTEVKVSRIRTLLPVESPGQGDDHVQERNFIYFDYRKQRYVYTETFSSFQRQNVRLTRSFAEIHGLRGGMDIAEAKAIFHRNGPNHIDIDSTPVLEMLLDKVVHPFYIFQLMSVLVWMSEAYYTYALLILLMSSASVAWEIRTAKQSENNLRSLVALDHTCKVIRSGRIISINAKHLVVGDAVVMENVPGAPIVCDMVLVQGNCVTDESSLTGEAVPIVKTPLPFSEKAGEVYAPEIHKSHTLFGGSTLVEVRDSPNVGGMWGSNDYPNEAIAIVTSTGFSSTKGELFRSILYPGEIDFKFYQDSYKFLGILSVVALAAFINRLVSGLGDRLPIGELLLSCVDLVTIAVPPALPLILTVGIGFSLDRLKKHQVFCIDPERINYAGRIDIMCWDKTGTLTLPALKWVGMEPAENGVFEGFTSDMREDGDMERALITCHGVNNVGGQLVGHSLDLEILRATGWMLQNDEAATVVNGQQMPLVAAICPPDSLSSQKDAYHVIKRFEFDARIQRSSVIVATASLPKLFSCTKGSPEAIRNICLPNSVPANFHALYKNYSSQGYYVLACGTKNLDGMLPTISAEFVAGLKRDELERDLVFAGFMLLQNPLKPESGPAIGALREASIRSIIITGDNALTAIHVARELSMCRKVLLVDMHENQAVFHEVEEYDPVPHDLARSSTLLRNSVFGSRSTQAPDASFSPAPMSRSGMHVSSSRPMLASLAAGGSSSNLLNPNVERTFPIEDLKRRLTYGSGQMDMALTGAALDHIISNYEVPFVEWLVGRTRIFARTKPSQKTWIVERLMGQGNYVGMCGDGTNDCGALKAAHVGVALSDAEASIVSPFTSARKSVADIVTLFKEGRCALETSFTAFKYMTLYPVCQLMMTATMYSMDTALANNQFLFDDIFVVLALALLMLYTGPAVQLIPDRPTDNLFSPLVLSSIIGQVAMCGIFFGINVAILKGQPWYCSARDAIRLLDAGWKPINPELGSANYPCYPIEQDDTLEGMLIKSYENTVIWLFTHFQFLCVAFAYTIVGNYRAPFYTNLPYAFALLIIGCILTGMLVTGDDTPGFKAVSWLFSLREGVPENFRFGVWVLAVANFAACVAWEWWVVDKIVRRWVAGREEQQKRAQDAKREMAIGIGRPSDIDLLDVVGLARGGGLGGIFKTGPKISIEDDVYEMGDVDGRSARISDDEGDGDAGGRPSLDPGVDMEKVGLVGGFRR